MESAINYYLFHIGDYAAHTRHLSLFEDLAYRRLLDAYYLAERPLSGCSADAAREIGMAEHSTAVDYVLTKFFTKNEVGNYINTRADREISHFQGKKQQASNAGKASAQRKFNARSTDVEQGDNGRLTDVQPTKNQEPITNNQRKKKAQAPSAYGDLLSDVDPQVVDDWMQLRKTKKATVTRTAVEELILEAGKAGYTPESALKECCARGWAGFKASWIVRDSPVLSAGLNKQEALEASNIAAAERFSKGVANGVF